MESPSSPQGAQRGGKKPKSFDFFSSLGSSEAGARSQQPKQLQISGEALGSLPADPPGGDGRDSRWKLIREAINQLLMRAGSQGSDSPGNGGAGGTPTPALPGGAEFTFAEFPLLNFTGKGTEGSQLLG